VVDGHAATAGLSPRGFVLLLLAAAPASDALAQVADDTVRSQIIIRRDTRLESEDLGDLRRRELEKIDWKLTLGVAAVEAESGDKFVTTPFLLRARFNEGKTALKLSGDGYLQGHVDGEPVSGFNDLNLMMTQAMALNTVLEAGVTFPAGGEVGSTHARQRLGALYHHVFSRRWEGQLHGRLTHYNTDPKPDVSPIRRQGVAQLAYNLDRPNSDVLLQLSRTYRPGSASATSVTGVYEFALSDKRRPTMASVGFTRGITSGVHDNTAEFDISLRF